MVTTRSGLSVSLGAINTSSNNTSPTSTTPFTKTAKANKAATPEPEEEDLDKEYETARCCECTTVKQFCSIDNGELTCPDCKNEKCYLCTDYDDDNHSVLSDEGEENEEGDELWRLHDDEADESIARAKEPNIPIASILEFGMNNIKFVAAAFNKKRLRKRAANTSVECKLMIAFHALMPDPRTIRAVWSHSEKKFTYRCDPANLQPFILEAFERALRPRALPFFEKAPHLGLDAYPWVRYEVDTLFFKYERCGNRVVDNQEYVQAMKSAADHLRAHVNAGNPSIARIRISWCQYQEDPRQVLGFFCRVPGVQSIDLEAHDHYTGAREDVMSSSAEQWQYDPSDMQHMVNNGSLRGYPFEVRLFSGPWNDYEEYVEGRKPLQGRGDCDDEEEDDEDGDSDDGYMY